MNPDLIDGVHDPRDTLGRRTTRSSPCGPRRSSKRLDPGRIVYHHASRQPRLDAHDQFLPELRPDPGDVRLVRALGDARASSRSFICEYGVPFTWDWTMYRGWYKGEREFGSAKVPWEFCLAEWNAQFLGDRAFRISEPEKANLRWEAKQFRAGKLWHRWDYPHQVGLAALRRAVRGLRRCTSPTTGAPSAPGACRRIRRGSTDTSGSCATGVDTRPQGVQGGLGEPAAARVQPGLHRPALRADGPGLRALRLGCHAGGAGAAPQQPAAAGLHRRQARGASRARTTTSSPARRSRSSSSSSTTRARR